MNCKFFVFLLVLVLVLIPNFCFGVSISANFTSSPRQVSAGSFFDFVRRDSGGVWGRSLHSEDLLYETLFQQMGTKHVQLFTGEQINLFNPSEGVYDYTTLDATIDDVLAQGFLPILRISDPPTWITSDKKEVFTNATKKAQFINSSKQIISHLRSKYGTQVQNWYFAINNEVYVFELGKDAFGNVNWGTGCNYWVDFWSEWNSAIKQMDPALKLAGPGEATSYEIRYLLNEYYTGYASKNSYGPKLISLLQKSAFVSYHHYGLDVRYTSYSNQQALNTAKGACDDLKLVRSSLDSKGLSNVKIFEEESNLNSDSQDPRSNTYIGGIYAALNIIDGANCGLNDRVHWWDYANPWGLKFWYAGNDSTKIYDSYYALKLLNTQVNPNSGIQYYQASPIDDGLDSYAIKTNNGLFLVLFNKKTSDDSASISITLPSSFSTSSALTEVFNYSEIRKDSTALLRKNALVLPVPANKVLSTTQTLEKESLTIIKISEAREESSCSIRIKEGSNEKTTLQVGKNYDLEITVVNSGNVEWSPLWGGTGSTANQYLIGSGTGGEENQGFLDYFTNGFNKMHRIAFNPTTSPFTSTESPRISSMTITPQSTTSGSINMAFRTLQELVKWFGNYCTIQVVINPASENCTNNIDDDGDRKIDCQDPDCPNTLTCDPSCQTPNCSGSPTFDWICQNRPTTTSCGTQNCPSDSCSVNTFRDYPSTCGKFCNSSGACGSCTCNYSSTTCGKTKSCQTTGCRTCDSGKGNCDENPATGTNGCETDLTNDSSNCGTCGTACASGKHCESSACIANPQCTTSSQCNDSNPCTADSCTGGNCVYSNTPSGTVCASQQTCNGTQVCYALTCNDQGSCSMPALCNECPNIYGTCASPYCLAGTCGVNFNQGASCGTQNCPASTCQDNNSASYPASCNKTCSSNGSCNSCTCSPTLSNCTIAKYCSQGVCQPCSAGTANCNQTPADSCEVNTNTSNSNCGACGNNCGTGKYCNAGVCANIPQCTSSSQCNDNNPCTTDTCTGGNCQFTPKTQGSVCETTSFCDANKLCSQKTCNSQGQCITPASCTDCPNLFGQCGQANCSNAACSNPILSGTSCNDNNSLTQNDTCNSFGACVGASMFSACTPDWSCSDWRACGESRLQTRTCVDLNNCNTNEGRPLLSRTCEPDTPAVECVTSSECSAEKFCENQKCIALNCAPDQEVINHYCFDIQHAECTSSQDCGSGKECKSEKCESIQCPQGKVLQGSQCIEVNVCAGIICSSQCFNEQGMCCNDYWNKGFSECKIEDVDTAVKIANSTNDSEIRHLAETASTAQSIEGNLEKAMAFATAAEALSKAKGKTALQQDINGVRALLASNDFKKATIAAEALIEKAKSVGGPTPTPFVMPAIPVELIVLVVLGIVLIVLIAYFVSEKNKRGKVRKGFEKEKFEVKPSAQVSPNDKEMQKIMRELKEELKRTK